jgi:hypothetical protein
MDGFRIALGDVAVDGSEKVLGFSMSQFGRKQIPAEGRCVVLRDTHTIGVHQSKAVRGASIPLLGATHEILQR